MMEIKIFFKILEVWVYSAIFVNHKTELSAIAQR